MSESLAKEEEQKAREDRLQQAIEQDNVDLLHNLIVEDQELLDRVSKHPFPHTPLHTAVATGKFEVAMEIIILRPSFARKLNPEGYSPMHLALQYQQYQIVRALMTRYPELIRVQGRGGITPLHYVAGKEGDIELELLAEFLCACKSSIKDLTNRCETAVHVAVKNHNLKAFKVLFGWLKRLHLIDILDRKDKDGNTVLHIAVSKKQLEIIKLLIGYVQVNTKNLQNETALEIFQSNQCDDVYLTMRLCWERCLARLFTRNISLSRFLSREVTFPEMFIFQSDFQDESIRSLILIVATLIATATYQAALSPPGGYWQDNSSNTPANSTVVAAKSSGIAVEKPHKAGEIILNGSNLYQFTGLNSSVFMMSIVVICYASAPLLPRSIPVYTLTICFCVAYIFSLITAFPRTDVHAGYYTTAIFLSLLLAVLATPVIGWFTYSRFLRGTDALARRVGKDQK